MSTQDEAETVRGWLAGRLPDDWFTEAVDVTIDREEITVVGRIKTPSHRGLDDDAKREADEGRIARFREDTRGERMRIADEAERRFDRKVAWGTRCGESELLFTRIAAPVMTRLRQPERVVLDTLVASGVARSRSHALAWCVRLVGEHTEDWLTELRDAMQKVDRVREQGPGV